MSGLIAIVGRPNVGKSALFNRIVGKRIAIVHDQAGVTRDRVSAEAEYRGRPFSLVDTGGIGLNRGEKSDDIIMQATVDQVDIAVEAADAIIFVVNVQEGIVPLDQEVAQRLRDYDRPVLVAVNKVDNTNSEDDVDVFSALGFDKIFPVSAIHGRGIDPLVGVSMGLLPPHEEGPKSDEEELDETLKICIVGRPNVGKSSIINALTQSERVIVSNIPGTTRDAVDVPFDVETDGVRQKYVLIDTAGVRKKRRVNETLEFFSVRRTETAIERSDIVVLVIDANDGVTEQDKKISDKIVEEKKACIIVINKWDLMEEAVAEARKEELRRMRSNADKSAINNNVTLGEFGKWVQEKMFFLSYAPVIFTSAHSGFHLDRLLESIRYVNSQLRQKIPTGVLNRTLQDIIERKQPSIMQGARLKFFYATQVSQSPPSFLLFVNRAELCTRDYEKYMEKQMRVAFGFEGCPLVLMTKARPKKVESIRRSKSTPGKSGGPRKTGVARKRISSDRSKPSGTSRKSSPSRGREDTSGRSSGPSTRGSTSGDRKSRAPRKSSAPSRNSAASGKSKPTTRERPALSRKKAAAKRLQQKKNSKR